MQQNNHNQSRHIQSLHQIHTSSQDQNIENRQIGSNYSTEANLSSQNDLKYNEIMNYGQAILDFNEIEEQKHEFGGYQQQSHNEGDDNQNQDDTRPLKSYKQFEFKQRQQQQKPKDHKLRLNQQEQGETAKNQYEKMDIVELDKDGKEITSYYQNKQLNQNQETNINIIINQPSQNLNSELAENKRKVHFQIVESKQKDASTNKKIGESDSKRKRQQGFSSNLKKQQQKPMDLQFVDGQYIKQNKSEYSDAHQSYCQNSNLAQYATSADKQSISSVNYAHMPIKRSKANNNHVSTQVDLQLSGKATKKYKQKVNIFKGKTTSKKINEQRDFSYQNADRNQNQLKNETNEKIVKKRGRKKRQYISQKQDKKTKRRMTSSNQKSLASKSPHITLAKQIDLNAQKDYLGSKYTWFLKDNDKLSKLRVYAGKRKGKQIIQKRISQRLSQNSQIESDSQNQTSSNYSQQNNNSSHLNIRRQSLRQKNKSTNKKYIQSNKKSPHKISANKYSHKKFDYEEQIDIDYIKQHMKQINVRSLMLQNAYKPLTVKDEILTSLLLSKKKDQDVQIKRESNNMRRDREIKRQSELNEEIKREQEQVMEYKRKQQQENTLSYRRVRQSSKQLEHRHQFDNNQNDQIIGKPANKLEHKQNFQLNITSQSKRDSRQLTLQQSFSRPKTYQKPKQTIKKPEETLNIKKVIDPNINHNGIYALLQLTYRSAFFFKFRYVLMPITNLSKVKRILIDQDYQKAQQLVGDQRDNLAYLPLTNSILQLIEGESRRRKSSLSKNDN